MRPVRAVLFDLEGDLYEGDRPVDGAAAAVVCFSGRGVLLLLLTNMASRPRAVLVEKLAGLRVNCCVDKILTPPVAGSSVFRTAAKCSDN